jgi:hypothetical protein
MRSRQKQREQMKLAVPQDWSRIRLILRFLRAQSKEDLDMVAQASPKLQKTVVKLLELSEDEEARMIYEAEVKAARDERARMRGAFEKGKVEG